MKDFITELNKEFFKQKYWNSYNLNLPIFTLLLPSLNFVYILLLWELDLAVCRKLCSFTNNLNSGFFRVFWTNTSLQRPVTPRVMYFTSKWRATTSDICLRWLPETPALVSFSLVLLVSVTKLRLWSFKPYTRFYFLFTFFYDFISHSFNSLFIFLTISL